jgi:hypothetical protein|tara:strand:- start:4187 stop:4384 length:198 start_codon:yes stop_codon:yes gene_type:complete
MKNYQAILLTIVGLGASYLTMNGTIQNLIQFEDVLNEIVFSVMGLMLGGMGLLSIDYKKLLKGLL